MKVILDITKSVDENAKVYYEKSKKAKKKLSGALKAIEITKSEALDASNAQASVKMQERKIMRKKQWFEKFLWFYSSDGFLCIGGRDAMSNEIVIKKHTEPTDIVLHTDMAGSPFVVIKSDGAEIPESTIMEASQFVASHSRAWKMGLSTLAVFYVKPDQVSKTANSGEYMPKGAFMVRGETKYMHPEVELCVGLYDDLIMVGPYTAVKAHYTGKVFRIVPGDLKKSDVAKLVRKEIGGELDDIISCLPAGGIRLLK